jgi:hypothetical protein
VTPKCPTLRSVAACRKIGVRAGLGDKRYKTSPCIVVATAVAATANKLIGKLEFAILFSVFRDDG